VSGVSGDNPGARRGWMRMPRDRKPTRLQHAYFLAYGVSLLALATALDALGVGPVPTRFYAVAIWLGTMGAALVRQIPLAQFGRRPTTAQAQEVRKEMVTVLAMTVVGVPIVYLLGEETGARWFQGAIEGALIVVVALIVLRAAIRRRAKR